jgi:hypothetical protein
MKPKSSRILSAALLIIALLSAAGWAAIAQASSPAAQDEPPSLELAGSPMLVSYQGVVKISGVPYTGTGYFKFAILNQAGTTVYWSNAPMYGEQPNAAVSLSVTSGRFMVLLGDTSLTDMAALTAAVFNGTERYFRVWFSSDNNRFTQLAPDRRIASAPYALQAEEAKNALSAQTAISATLATSATNSSMLGGLKANAFWQLTGNSGTTPASQFLGTSDAQPLVLRTNNLERARLDTSGNLGLGTSTPMERLTVGGNALVLGDDNPVARGYTSTDLSGPQSVFVAGRYAYVTSMNNSQLAIFDISDPDNIYAKGTISTNLSGPISVYVAGRYAYVASTWNDLLAIFDVSDPNAIVAKGYTSTNLDSPYSVYVAGRFAYVVSWGNSRLVIFDISDPDNIVARGYTVTNMNLNGPHSVYVAGRYAYMASKNNDRLVIFDVSDPDNIVAKGYTSTNLYGPQSVFVSGRYAYVASTLNNQLAIFDVSYPLSIVAKGYTSTNLDMPISVYVAGHYAYVASWGNSSLAVFDVSDPENIVAKGYTSTNLDMPVSVFVAGHYAYVANSGNSRLAIFDLNHLESPTLETGALFSGNLQVSNNAIVNNDLSVQGGLTVGPGGAQVGGDLGVEGGLKVVSGYIQLPTISGAAPPAADCDDPSEYGRMLVRTDGATNLYVCTASGWVGK